MADVTKIKLPDNSTVNIKDYRIPGVDSTPTPDSENLVTSGGVYQDIEDASRVTSAALNVLNDRLSSVEENLDNVQDLIQIDEFPEEDSENLITSGGVYSALIENELATASGINDLDERVTNLEEGIPTKTSDLENDSGFITSEDLEEAFEDAGDTFVKVEDYEIDEEVFTRSLNDLNDRIKNTYNKNEVDTLIQNVDVGEVVNQVNIGQTEYTPTEGVVTLPAYPTTLPASDVSAWAKADTKPTYTASEVGAQETLVSGTNIKTINSETLLGSGNIDVQPVLVSGTNIKTINNASILGSGNITISADGTVQTDLAKIFYGTCSTAAATTTKAVTCPGFTAEDLVKGALIFVTFDYTNSGAVASLNMNVNSTGAKRLKKVRNASAPADLSHVNELQANVTYLFSYNGTQWVLLTSDYNTNTTYTAMTSSEANTGTATTARTITAAILKSAIEYRIKQYQPDWNQTTTTAADYIENKPIDIIKFDDTVYADWVGNTLTSLTEGTYTKIAADLTAGVIPTLVLYSVADSCFVTFSFLEDDRTNNSVKFSTPINNLGVAKTITVNSDDTVTCSSYTIQGGSSGSGEANVIEAITFNGTPATITNKTAAITATIPSEVTEATVSGWGFTKNTGTLTSETDPVFTASTAASITSADVSAWNGKQDAISDLSDIRSGAALGATALQSYTETDPTVPAWAKAANKPTYTASEVGALPDTTVIPAAVTESTVAGWGFTKNSGTLTSETDPVFTASAAHGISSTDISNWNAKQKAITISSSEPTASQGSNGDIWIVI